MLVNNLASIDRLHVGLLFLTNWHQANPITTDDDVCCCKAIV